MPACARPFGYVPRQTHECDAAVLVRRHLAEFLGRCEERPGPLPAFVKGELEGFAGCGDFELGFVRTCCRSCGDELRVPFSCKSRGCCPSCIARQRPALLARRRLLSEVEPSRALSCWAQRRLFVVRCRGERTAAVEPCWVARAEPLGAAPAVVRGRGERTAGRARRPAVARGRAVLAGVGCCPRSSRADSASSCSPTLAPPSCWARHRAVARGRTGCVGSSAPSCWARCRLLSEVEASVQQRSIFVGGCCPR